MAGHRNIVFIDTETTGFAFNRNDRVIEVGAIKYDSDFNEIARFETLLNPGRDLGPQHIHKIDASWVLDAPDFSQISLDLLDFLTDSVIVGHNVDFDLRFLESEFRRSGMSEVNLLDFGVCTKKIAGSLGVKSASLSLENLCLHFGISNNSAHAALDDALATASLLRELISMNGSIGQFLKECELFSFGVGEHQSSLQNLKPRPRIPTQFPSGFIARLVRDLPVTNNVAADVGEYSVYLSRALSDLHLSQDEIEALVELASEIGLSVEEVAKVHSDFVTHLIEKAWSDGVVSDFERAELEVVAKQLGISEFELEIRLSNKARNLLTEEMPFQVGDLVALTGTMNPPKIEIAKMVEARGGVVADTLSKKTKLLIAADPHTLSGKGQQARKLGVRVISTAQFLSLNSL